MPFFKLLFKIVDRNVCYLLMLHSIFKIRYHIVKSTGTASCSVLGHDCPTEITCESIDGCDESNVYQTRVEFEGSDCAWCPVCIAASELYHLF